MQISALHREYAVYPVYMWSAIAVLIQPNLRIHHIPTPPTHSGMAKDVIMVASVAHSVAGSTMVLEDLA